MKYLAFVAAFIASLLITIPAQAEDDRRFVFSYQFSEGDDMAPRGGTSRGTPITLASDDHPGWTRLQADGLDDFERDRRAILAMAGGYRASFDFLEMEGYSAAFTPAKPYQSWGTEYVYVVEDRGSFISLQHVLVMTILGEGDEIIGPFVTKHWRQDWRYEDDSVLTYRGFGRWESVGVADEARRGTWSQAVWQVDDSPRYEGIGRWRHEADFSAWVSEETARPLPRREFSVRDDYQALVGTNVHTITREGWTHRQDNLKAVLDETGRPVSYLAREYGMNRYQRITGFDFTPGDEYLERTGPFWAEVRRVWDNIVSEHPRFQLAGDVDGEKLFSPMFAYAEEVGEQFDPEQGRAAAREIIDRYLSIDPDPLGADLADDSY
ncbi:MAG: DUF6607 family protein [Pseudomonadota bacterium]